MTALIFPYFDTPSISPKVNPNASQNFRQRFIKTASSLKVNSAGSKILPLHHRSNLKSARASSEKCATVFAPDREGGQFIDSAPSRAGRCDYKKTIARCNDSYLMHFAIDELNWPQRELWRPLNPGEALN
jgi:hypothetical protein